MSPAPAATPLPEPPPPADDWALFLDVDGCLLEIAPHPDEVRVPPGLVPALERLEERLGGAVALVSGRPLATLDRLFAPLVMAAAGQHGLERRNAVKRLLPLPALPRCFAEVEASLERFTEHHPGTLLEKKSRGLALHFRGAPACGEEAQRLAIALAEQCVPPLIAVPGKAVIELRTPGADKGKAIADFMKESPFAGRLPVFLGDDVTDEDGFAVVNALGGHSILVGRRPTRARWALTDVAAVHHWLSAAAVENF